MTATDLPGRLAPPARRARLRLSGAATLVPFALPALLVLGWEAGSALGLISDRLLPRPSTVVATGWAKLASGELLRHLGTSALRALAGLVIGGAVGFGLGLMNGLSARAHRVTDTTLQMVRNIPILALMPLVIVWFGIGEGAKLFIVALSVFFPIYLNTAHGIRSVDPQLIEMGRAYGMSGRTLFRKVLLPGSLPSIFVGLRYALGIMWLVLIVAETLASSRGLGYMANQAREFMLLDVVVLAILLYALLGKLADVVTRALERRTLRWNPAYA
jgi:sulfonate transport system permease protein